jgi:nicotinamide-nucleotide adenylyltransferase
MLILVFAMPVVKRALFTGRFQPFHNGHLSAVEEILREYGELVIVVGSAQENLTARNPLTSGERIEMILNVLKARNLLGRCYVIPVPDTPESGLWPERVLSYSPKVGAVFTGNDYVAMLFDRHGVKVRKQKMVGGISSTRVRQLIAKKDASWKKLVPVEVAAFLEGSGLSERIRSLTAMDAKME